MNSKYYESLKRNAQKWIDVALNDIADDQKTGFLAMVSPILENESAMNVLPTICESGTHYANAGGAHEITSRNWQIFLQDAVEKLKNVK